MQIRPFIGTAVFCAVVAFITAQVHSGFLLIFVLPFLAIWLLYSIYVACKYAARRKMQSIKVALWLLAVGSVLLIHWRYYVAARNAANFTVEAIYRYKTSHGSFPDTLGAAGVKDYRNGWIIFYSKKDGKPILFYPATFVIYDTYRYDFEHKSWVYQPD